MDVEKAPTAADLERRFARWQVWQADTGEWWASVRRNLTPNQERAGCRPHLCAPSPCELERLIAQEDARV